jgi:hypothetical protein
MKYGKDNLCGGALFLLMKINGDTPSIITNRNRPIAMYDYIYLCTVPSQCLIDRVIYHLKDHVVKA